MSRLLMAFIPAAVAAVLAAVSALASKLFGLLPDPQHTGQANGMVHTLDGVAHLLWPCALALVLLGPAVAVSLRLRDGAAAYGYAKGSRTTAVLAGEVCVLVLGGVSAALLLAFGGAVWLAAPVALGVVAYAGLRVGRYAQGNELSAAASLQGTSRADAVPVGNEHPVEEGQDPMRVTTATQRPEQTTPTVAPTPARTLTDVFAETDRLIGLRDFKANLRREVTFVRAEELKREADPTYEGRRMRRHCIYPGPPGTGKTMCAGLHADALTALGISNGCFGHTTAGELLSGGAVGAGREKTRAWLESIAGGVGFVDEFGAVTEAKHSTGDAGQEVIAEFLNWMENRADCPIIIAAGYGEQIDQALRMDRGFASRFGARFEFVPYTPEELVEIAELEAGKDKHRLSPAARAELGRALKALYERYADHPSWSSGRVASTLYGEAKWAQAQHLAERVAADSGYDRFLVETEDVREAVRKYLANRPFPPVQPRTVTP